MNRALWLLGEIVLGLMLAGALTAVAVPALMQRGWDAGPPRRRTRAWHQRRRCACVIGERLREGPATPSAVLTLHGFA